MNQLLEPPQIAGDVSFPGPNCVRSLLQPIYDVGDGQRKIVATEALARGPRGTVIEPPTAMFAAARLLDMVDWLDRECIASGLRAGSVVPSDVGLYLNVHPATLCRDCSFPAVLAAAAKACEVPLNRVTLEVLEYARVSECECRQLHAALDVLRDRGVRIAVDDVGGEAEEVRRAFAYRPDCIKLDGNLVRGARSDIRRRALIHALLEMAEMSRTAVIAEGISNPKDFEWVTGIGIRLVQGFLLAYPMSPDELCAAAGWPTPPSHN